MNTATLNHTVAQISSSYRNMQLLIFAIIVTIIISTFYISSVRVQLSESNMHIIHTTYAIDLELTSAHLWLEEIIAGDDSLSLKNDVWFHLDNAEKHMQHMLHTAGEQSQQKITTMLEQIRLLRHIAKERLITPQAGATNSLDQKFDKLYQNIEILTGEVKKHAQAVVAHDLKSLNIIRYAVVSTLLLAFLMIALLLHKLEKNRQNQQQKELILASFPEENPNPVLFVNEQKKLTYANQAGKLLLERIGVKLNEKIPQTWFDYCNTQKQKTSSSELTIELESYSYLLHFEQALDCHTHIYAHDITELRTSQKEHLQLAEIIKQTTDLVSIIKPNGQIVYMNPAGRQLLDITTTEDISQENIFTYLADEESLRMKKEIIPAANSNGTWSGETTYKQTNGETCPVSCVFLGNPGRQKESSHYSIISRDIREEKDLQSKLEHTQRLESLGVLAGGIAHDFNNLLTAILGNAALAGKMFDGQHPVKNKLTHITKTSEKAAKLCHQMLAYSGKGQFIIQPIHLGKVITEMVGLMEVAISKDVSIHYDLNEAIPFIEGDMAQVQQVMMNLVTNANEAIENNKPGAIKITTDVTYLDAEDLKSSYSGGNLPSGEYVVLSITDSGSGIKPEILSKIFDPFFTTKFTGRGLGMSAVLGIIRGHKAALKIHSQIGKGTRFKVFFPATEKKEDTVWDKTIAIQPHAFDTVLIIDDEEIIRETGADILQELGFKTVLKAQDGLVGIELYQKHHQDIQVVLLDMTMPKLNGAETFIELQRINPDVKVILSSGYSEQEATLQFEGKGLAGFIQKPYLPQDLESMITNTLFTQVV